jgi:hypothetical protein
VGAPVDPCRREPPTPVGARGRLIVFEKRATSSGRAHVSQTGLRVFRSRCPSRPITCGASCASVLGWSETGTAWGELQDGGPDWCPPRSRQSHNALSIDTRAPRKRARSRTPPCRACYCARRMPKLAASAGWRVMRFPARLTRGRPALRARGLARASTPCAPTATPSRLTVAPFPRVIHGFADSGARLRFAVEESAAG